MEIRENLGFQSSSDPGKYLRIPIFHNRVNKHSFQFIIDKVNQRLSAWKARTLSLAGKLTLTKSVLQALPTYTIQYCMIPKGVCADIDKICRGFIWGFANLRGREAWAYPLYMRYLNTTFMMKASCNLCSLPTTLWKTIIKAKYNTGHSDFSKVDPKK